MANLDHHSALERVRRHLRTTDEDDLDETYEDFVDEGLSQGVVDHVEQTTRGQADNPRWIALRKGLVTASNIKKVVTAMKTSEKRPWIKHAKLLHTLMHGNGAPLTPAIEWGQDNEEEALDDYWREMGSLHDNFKLGRPGLFLSSSNPLVGASPDGVLYPRGVVNARPVKVIEVKCPYGTRFRDPEEAALKEACETGWGGTLRLKSNHTWFYQIQAQMGVVGVNRADLVVYTQEGVEIVPVPFDRHFFDDMMERVGEFTKDFLYPELVDECDY